ncbi:hypothetical protein M231_03310 [Tremella mesenterica]|uniref:Uncharacterized protein n=1 Tax=Tremella mesenterica TaxID=5217 RepID=A0A4V1M484_TREME|nr:hypothetical protein M231_03310 [Tremella mesenterica]
MTSTNLHELKLPTFKAATSKAATSKADTLEPNAGTSPLNTNFASGPHHPTITIIPIFSKDPPMCTSTSLPPSGLADLSQDVQRQVSELSKGMSDRIFKLSLQGNHLPFDAQHHEESMRKAAFNSQIITKTPARFHKPISKFSLFHRRRRSPTPVDPLLEESTYTLVVQPPLPEVLQNFQLNRQSNIHKGTNPVLYGITVEDSTPDCHAMFVTAYLPRSLGEDTAGNIFQLWRWAPKGAAGEGFHRLSRSGTAAVCTEATSRMRMAIGHWLPTPGTTTEFEVTEDTKRHSYHSTMAIINGERDQETLDQVFRRQCESKLNAQQLVAASAEGEETPPPGTFRSAEGYDSTVHPAESGTVSMPIPDTAPPDYNIVTNLSWASNNHSLTDQQSTNPG